MAPKPILEFIPAALCRNLQSQRRMSQMACMLTWQQALFLGEHPSPAALASDLIYSPSGHADGASIGKQHYWNIANAGVALAAHTQVWRRTSALASGLATSPHLTVALQGKLPGSRRRTPRQLPAPRHSHAPRPQQAQCSPPDQGPPAAPLQAFQTASTSVCAPLDPADSGTPPETGTAAAG